MLKFDLTELLRTPGMRQVYELHEPPYADDDVEFVAPVVGRIVVTNTGSMVLVRGPIDTTVEMECSRCLESVRAPIHADLEEEFELSEVEDASQSSGSRFNNRISDVKVVEDEVGRVFDGKTLQMNVLIRQAALLAVPLQPLCREACPGIPVQETDDPDEAAIQNSPFRELGKLLQE